MWQTRIALKLKWLQVNRWGNCEVIAVDTSEFPGGLFSPLINKGNGSEAFTLCSSMSNEQPLNKSDVFCERIILSASPTVNTIKTALILRWKRRQTEGFHSLDRWLKYLHCLQWTKLKDVTSLRRNVANSMQYLCQGHSLAYIYNVNSRIIYGCFINFVWYYQSQSLGNPASHGAGKTGITKRCGGS